jgi:hypothetical protein
LPPVTLKGLYPASPDDYEDLADAIERLTLNDASVTVKKENSDALGAGFRCAVGRVQNDHSGVCGGGRAPTVTEEAWGGGAKPLCPHLLASLP